MADRKIHTSDGDEVQWLKKEKDYYLDKSTLIFGGTGSGKTTIIEEILYIIKDDIPNCIAIVSENSRKAYDGKLDAKCIKDNLTKDKIMKIWRRQSNITKCYNIANDIKNLKSLFDRIDDKNSRAMITALDYVASKNIKSIKANTQTNITQQETQITAITELHIKRTKEVYKDTIKKYTDQLKFNPALTINELVTLEYLDVNPRLLIILDDVSDKFEGWMSLFKKSETNPFESIFYQGRWNYITLIFAAHDDKIVETQLRKNSRVTIYTNSQSAISAFERKGNAYSTHEKKYVQRVVAHIYDKEEARGIKTHQKLCYIREASPPFRYTIASKYPEFRLGCIPLTELVKKLPQKTDNLADNPYIRQIIADD